MATKQSTIDFLMDQISSLGNLRYRKMFGEYAIYYTEKVVAFVCDDQLLIKPTVAGKAFIGTVDEAPPYPGAKMYYRIDQDLWENREWMMKLLVTTANELPFPKPKRKKA